MVNSEKVLQVIEHSLEDKRIDDAYSPLTGEALAAAFATVAKIVELETTVLMTREHLEAMESGILKRPPASVDPSLN